MKPLEWHTAAFARLASSASTLPHAILFHGMRGTGKLVFARALAQRLLCENAAGDTACGACTACAWFESGTHPDYRQVEPERGDEAEEGEDDRPRRKKREEIAVDQIRALADFVNVSSHRGGPKVIVLHPAEMLNPNAANALLKSLEEPPPRTHFILVAHRPHLVLPTIRSRCQQVALPAPNPADAAKWLETQGVRNAEVALAHTGGAPLLALELGETGYWGARAAFLRHLAAPEVDVLRAAASAGDCPIPHVIAWLQKWSYDVAHYAAVGRVRFNPDYAEPIARAASRARRLDVVRFHREMVQHQQNAQHPLNTRLFLEHVLLAYRDAVQPAAAAA